MRVLVSCECTDIMCLKEFDAIVDEHMFAPDCECGEKARIVNIHRGCIVESSVKDGQLSMKMQLYVLEKGHG